MTVLRLAVVCLLALTGCDATMPSTDPSLPAASADASGAPAKNLVPNPAFAQGAPFEQPPVNNPPTGWDRYIASGSAAIICQVQHPRFGRPTMVMSATPGAYGGDTYAYSAAFPVTEGATYRVRTAGYASTFIATKLTVDSRVAWFATAEAPYPRFVSEIVVGTNAVNAESNADIGHAGQVVAPAGAKFARIALRASSTGRALGSGSAMYWAGAEMVRG